MLLLQYFSRTGENYLHAGECPLAEPRMQKYMPDQIYAMFK
jgi:hypothetical protein